MTQFDPRLIPRVGDGRSDPRPSPQRLSAEGLRARFAHPPVWEPELRRETRFSDRAPAQAAVLVPLVMRQDGLYVLLTLRTADLSTHAGQIALPGGRVDPQDRDVVAAALREAHEEVGLHSAWVEVLGTLPLYVTGTAFEVTPVVALVQAAYVPMPNPAEVAEVFEVPLDFLMNPKNHHIHEVEWQAQRRRWYAMPYTHAGTQRFIWGATAGMLRNLYRFLVA